MRSMTTLKLELETMVQVENYDVIAITDMWWDESHINRILIISE